MAKQFNIYLKTDTGDSDYLGSYHAKTFSEAVRAAIKDNDLNPQLYDKKQNTYDGYKIMEEE